MKQTLDGLKQRESEHIAAFLKIQIDFGFTFASISLAAKERDKSLADDAKCWALKVIDTVKYLVGLTPTEDAFAIDRRLVALERLVLKL